MQIGERQILVRSCNGAGKTKLLADAVAYEMSRYDNLQIICTGANNDALYHTLWAAVKRSAKRAGLDTKGFNAKSWEIGSASVVAVSPAKIESAQGFHAERTIVIADEATRHSQDMVSALMSNISGEGYAIFTFNPINTDSAMFALEESGDWWTYGISAFDHPNVINGSDIIRGAINRESLEAKLRVDSERCDPGEQDAIVLPWNGNAYLPTAEAVARALGKWSDVASIGFISGKAIVEAWKVQPADGLRVAGADIGAGNDPSVWTHFAGNAQEGFDSINTSEMNVVANRLERYCIENRIDVLGVDDTGVGHAVSDRLRDRALPFKLYPVNFSSSPYNFPEVKLRQPANARAEMYFLFDREVRNQSIRILYDKELQRELTCQKIDVHSKSQMSRIEDKRLIAKRIGHSPNKADATVLARYARRIHDYQNRPRIY